MQASTSLQTLMTCYPVSLLSDRLILSIIILSNQNIKVKKKNSEAEVLKAHGHPNCNRHLDKQVT